MPTPPCPFCGRPIVEIVLSSGGDSPIVMRSCSRCDAKGWSSDGRAIDLREALADLSESPAAQRRRREVADPPRP